MYDLLKGLTIVEGAAFIAAPSCALHFAQMGATVIRFDQIGGGPDARRWPRAENGASYYWEGLNKGKKSIALDLTRPEGRVLARRLATSGDGLFVTNFPAEGFLSHERLSALRLDLVTLRIMGWADGAPAGDYTINAALGVPLITGHPDDPSPVNHVLPAWDLIAGAYGAFALLAAERDRRESGQGREVRLALSDIAIASLGHLGQIAETLASEDRPRVGNDLFGAFGRDFATREGHRLMLVAITSRQWTGLLDALDVGEQIAALEARTGVSFREEGQRFLHRAELNAIVANAIAARDLSDLSSKFDKAGVCWSRYQSLGEAVANEPRFVSANPVFSTIDHPGGSYPTPGAAAQIADLARRPPEPAPRIGAHTDEILIDVLGLSSHEIGRLHDAGLVQ